MFRRFWLIAGCAGALAIAACNNSSTTPAAPLTQTWIIDVGQSSPDGAFQGLNFYPNSITIDAGDTITWNIQSTEPHTITLLAIGQATPPPPVSANLGPAGGATFDGTTYTSSGLLNPQQSYKLTFTTPGTYTVYCLIHQPEMLMTVHVQAAGSSYPQTQQQLFNAAQTASQADLSAAQAAPALFPYAVNGPHLAAGISPGLNNPPPSNATVLRFLDDTTATSTNVTIAVGGSVTWTNLTLNEVHTVTFGIAGQPFPTLSPFGPPQGGPAYDGTVITNSGVIPPGGSYTLTFTKAGTYTYHCLFHDEGSNMIATVTVQ